MKKNLARNAETGKKKNVKVGKIFATRKKKTKTKENC
jgi:hypothetical protein